MGIQWDDILDDETGDGGSVPVGGPYVAKVEYAEGVVAQSGNPMVKLKFAVVGGPYNGNEIWTNVVIVASNPNAMKFTLRKFAALGVTREWLRENKPSEVQIAEKLKAEAPLVEITVQEGNEYQGEKRPEVKNIKAYKGAQPTPAAAPTPTPAASMPKPTLPTPTVQDAPPTPEPF